MADGFVDDLANLLDDAGRESRRGLSLDDRHAVVADDDTGFGSPSTVKAQRPSPISVKEVCFTVASPRDANAFAILVSCP
jgi:hypothetical protein